MTAPRSSTARSPGPRRSRRAASSACIVSGSCSVDEPAFQREREQLLEEERISFCGLDDARPLVGLEDHAAETVEERFRLFDRQGVEHDPLGVLAIFEELGSIFEQLVAGDADDEDRPFAAVGDALDQLEEGRLRPVQVVEDEHERASAGHRLAEPAEEQGDLGRRWRGLGIERREDRVALLAFGRLLDRVAERPVGDAFAVRQAAAPERRHALGATRELGGEA